MKIISMSISTSALILAVVFIRALLINKLPKTTFLILWGITLCRLLIPLSIPSRLSAYNAVSNLPIIPTDTHQVTSAVLNINSSSSVAEPILEKASTIQEPVLAIPIFASIWIIGIILIATFFLVTHFRFHREYKTALPIKDEFIKQWKLTRRLKREFLILQSDKILSPLTYGVWKPVILLPKMMEYEDQSSLQYILTHEFIHIKSFDILKKWILAIALCVHWFNPLVWVMYILANRDIELTCDEAVVKIFGDTNKAAYALTLLDMEEEKDSFTLLCNNFSKNALEERITAIMRIKKTTFISILLTLLLVTGITISFATSAVEGKSMGMFEKAFADNAVKYVANINKPMENTSRVIAEDYTIFIDSTIFTDNNVYAIIGAKGNLHESFSINGRIVYAEHEQTAYSLKSDIKELEPVDDVRYFFYSATIGEVASTQAADPILVIAAGNNFLKYNSLRDNEGKILELRVNLNKKDYILKTTVTNVSTEALVFHPTSDLYKGDYYSTVILTPWELKMNGQSKKNYSSYEEWDKLNINLTILLSGGKKINMNYDEKGTSVDEGYPLGMSRGADIETGKFYHWWSFREWKLDLNEVRAIILDGKTYRLQR